MMNKNVLCLFFLYFQVAQRLHVFALKRFRSNDCWCAVYVCMCVRVCYCIKSNIHSVKRVEN